MAVEFESVTTQTAAQLRQPARKLLFGLNIDSLRMDEAIEHCWQAVQTRKPVAWGVLTPDTQDQALDRAGLKFGNKGREAALAAVETLSVLDALL
ncbi:6,7-dimethyl-8-ribityllumazine synthase [bacterium]|nr:MAG: 6,7-dimethyl-8-ribityllumazine synthase [bacterium]